MKFSICNANTTITTYLCYRSFIYNVRSSLQKSCQHTEMCLLFVPWVLWIIENPQYIFHFNQEMVLFNWVKQVLNSGKDWILKFENFTGVINSTKYCTISEFCGKPFPLFFFLNFEREEGRPAHASVSRGRGLKKNPKQTSLLSTKDPEIKTWAAIKSGPMYWLSHPGTPLKIKCLRFYQKDKTNP